MLNILVLSNYYPPHNIGGYELGCRDVVRGLEERGHRVTVLTSTYGDGPGSDGEVHRRLTIKYRAHLPRRAPVRAAYLAALLARERRDQRLFRELAAGLKPDLLYVWNASGISISLLRVARSMGIPTCVFVSDEWLARFPADDVWVRYWPARQAGRRVSCCGGRRVPSAWWRRARSSFRRCSSPAATSWTAHARPAG
jgi:hypothetical protein